MVAAVIFSNNVWTFWDVMLLFFIFIPLLMVWFFAIFDVFARRDLSGWGKAAWLVAIIVFPWLGTLIYLIVRPREEDTYAQPTYAYSSPGPSTVQQSQVEQIQSLDSLRASGAINDDEYARMKARVIGDTMTPA